MILPDASITVERLGREGEPLVIIDHFTGQQVTLRRTDPASGKTVEERATIRSSQGGVLIDTPRGIEAVYCTDLAQTLLYPEAPATLSPKPVLSMTTRDQPGGK